MAYITTIADVHKNRPFKPRYARTQATAQAVVINDTDAPDIFPGCVLMRGQGPVYDDSGALVETDGTGEVSIFKAAASTVPAGICGTFAKELELTGQKDVAMWVLGDDAIFACSMFDTAASWGDAITDLAAGKPVLLTATASASGDVPAGALTIGDDTTANVARLVGVEAYSLTASAPTTILIAGL